MSLITDDLLEVVIEQIEKRPALYKKNLKQYADARLKLKLWDEVCEAVIPEWNNLVGEEKRKQSNEIQKKWNNLRTCFRRELNAQKSSKSGQATTKRRKYVYFEKLLFLLPHMENREREGNASPVDDDDDTITPHEAPAEASTSVPRRKKRNEAKQASRDIDEALLKALDDTRDEDTNFALSLVPSLRALTAEEKLDAKINILQIFKNITLARRSQAPYTILQHALPPYIQEAHYSQQQPQHFQHMQQSHHTNIISPPMTSPLEQRTQAMSCLSSPGCSTDTSRSYVSDYINQPELYKL